MKLLQSITRKYVISAVAVLVLFTVAMYFIVNSLLESGINERLVNSKGQLVGNYRGGSLKIFPYFEIEEIPALPPPGADVLKDTLIFNTVENEHEVFREYVSYQELQHTPHKITVRVSLIEKEDMITAFSLIFGVSSALLLLALFIINKKTTTALFAPFYGTLAQMQHFSLRSSVPLVLEDGAIDEFRELNSILMELTARARKEYTSIKEFSENASHELQTPLAVVTAKLDLLIQKENLDEEEQLLIASIYQTIGRLTQLNKALLLLSQIETAGYFEETEVDVSREVLAELDAIAPIAEYRNIAITRSIAAAGIVKANGMLISVLIKNILSNAVKHNRDGGTIAVTFDGRTLTVENSGDVPECATDALFERFKKSGTAGDSVGLGLAVVKEICTLYRFGVGYRYAAGIHTVIVSMRGL